MDIVSNMTDSLKKQTPKSTSGVPWLVAGVIVLVAIWAINASGRYDEQQQLRQATQEAQQAEALNQKCTQANFMSSKDYVTVPGRMEIINASYNGAMNSKPYNSDTYTRSWNAWMANGCD